MANILRDVIQRGTAIKARALGRSDVGGKTGTFNDAKDAWFAGIHPRMVTTVWVGLTNLSVWVKKRNLVAWRRYPFGWISPLKCSKVNLWNGYQWIIAPNQKQEQKPLSSLTMGLDASIARAMKSPVTTVNPASGYSKRPEEQASVPMPDR